LVAERLPKQVLDRLAEVPLFSACTKTELRTIARLGTSLNVPNGSILTQQGKAGFEFFLLLEGMARCLVDDREVATLDAGEFFGEMALLDHGPRHATVVADGPVRVLVLDAREFAKLLDTSPKISLKLLKAVALRTRANWTMRD
jgi:CRP/FNR family transcriptional regulator, cyclic AMP receptor protein